MGRFVDVVSGFSVSQRFGVPLIPHYSTTLPTNELRIMVNEDQKAGIKILLRWINLYFLDHPTEMGGWYILLLTVSSQ